MNLDLKKKLVFIGKTGFGREFAANPKLDDFQFYTFRNVSFT